VSRIGTIAKYDYVHQAQNLLHYGHQTPPTYDITKILTEFSISLGVGGQDMLSDVQDVNLLLNDLKDHDSNKLVVLLKDNYAHVDFIAAINAKQVVYDPIRWLISMLIEFTVIIVLQIYLLSIY
jgi:lysosomal acid lipase/cholesteryl ester hydrolase